MNKSLYYNREKCIECRACESICVHENGRSPLSSSLGLFCHQCGNAFCIEACTKNAIVKNSDGYITTIPERCNGCQSCIIACPIVAIAFDEEGPVICNLCNGKTLCFDVCPRGAISSP